MSVPGDFVIRDDVLTKYVGPGGDVAVPDGVKTIAARAFKGCAALTGIALPEGVERIGDEAFADCAALKDLILPEGLWDVGASAFSGCAALTAAELPASLKYLDPWAFSGCTGLTCVSLPERLHTVSRGVFADCENLRAVRIREGAEAVCDYAFARCVSLRELALPKTLRRVDEKAFLDCRGLADEKGFLVFRGTLCQYFGPPGSAEIPEGVLRIGPQSFPEDAKLLRLSIPESVGTVDPRAFPEGADLVLRIRRWIPELTGAVKDCRVLAVDTEEPESLPPGYGRALRLGRVLKPEKELDTEEGREDAAWLARNAAAIRRDVIALPEALGFFCRHRLIRPGSVDAYLTELRERNDPELTALMLAYRSSVGEEKLEKAREEKRRREDAALEARARKAARTLEDGLRGLTFVVEGPTHLIGSRTPLWRTLKRLLEARGARLSRNVTPAANYLVCVDPKAEPEKHEKAEELGIPLLSWGEFSRLLGLQGKE